jgi:RNA 2',3'-cyclic 3'-phosphodiesterase
MRCFIALELPEETKKTLAALSGRLETFFPDARWVRPDSFHITLAFLGDIEEPAQECARLALDAVAGTGAFDLGFSGLLSLPERTPARVLALKAGEGQRECARAYEGVNRALAEAASERKLGILNPEWPDGRPFRVHVTLARAGRQPFSRNTTPAWAGIQSRLQAPIRINRCILYRSELRQDGAQYEPLRTVML